jgi:CRISPR/Cas system-associated exonuclease Cas4 (RecB family)
METTTMAAAAMVSPDKPLTEKQRAYAVARARGESVPNAMAIAGYNEQVSYGYRLDKMPNVQRLIQQEQALYAEAAQMDRKKVIDMQLEAYEMAKTMAEPATMVSAAREIGKICGLYEPKKVEVSVNGSVRHEIHRFEAMSDDELLKLLSQGYQGGENATTPLLQAPDAPQ